MLRFRYRMRHRNLPAAEGSGSGPAGRISKMRKLVTALVRHERIEGKHPYMDESRGYAERLIEEAIRNGDKHKPTMELADYWLLEKDLVHKLFKVLVPRYQSYRQSYTQMWNLPTVYPGGGYKMALLELKGAMDQILASLLPPDAKADAKKYIHENQIPRLFECITAGLLHHRPQDPVQFVQDCLDSVRYQKGVQLTWDIFIEWRPPAPGSFNPSRSASAMVRPDSMISETGTPRQVPHTPLHSRVHKSDDPFIFEEDSGIASGL